MWPVALIKWAKKSSHIEKRQIRTTAQACRPLIWWYCCLRLSNCFSIDGHRNQTILPHLSGIKVMLIEPKCLCGAVDITSPATDALSVQDRFRANREEKFVLQKHTNRHINRKSLLWPQCAECTVPCPDQRTMTSAW